jgi:hypothetical protein
VREYFIPDFSRWKEHDSYQAALGKLVVDLKAVGSGEWMVDRKAGPSTTAARPPPLRMTNKTRSQGAQFIKKGSASYKLPRIQKNTEVRPTGIFRSETRGQT